MAPGLVIGILPDPAAHPDWPLIEALLAPAAEMAGLPVLGGWERLWIVADAGEVIAAATTRRMVDGLAEIILCGGRDFRRWAADLQARIADWARIEGMHGVVTAGRRGWTPLLTACGWHVAEDDGRIAHYERGL